MDVFKKCSISSFGLKC